MRRVCESSPPVTVTMTMDGAAPRHARRFLDDHWCVEHAALLRPQAELVVTELVSNAVQHGEAPVVLSLDCGGVSGVVISVSDANPNLPRVQTVGPHAASGRGVRLVELLSDEWGVKTRPGGKSVWSRLVA